MEKAWASLWPPLQESFHKILTEVEGLHYEWEDVDTLIHKNMSFLLTRPFNQGERFYTAMKELIARHLETKVRTEVVNEMNYSSSSSNFLRVLSAAWNDYYDKARTISILLKYRHDYYEPQHNFYNICLSLFEERVLNYDHVRNHLRKVLAEMTTRDRRDKGKESDKQALKDACHMLLQLGIRVVRVAPACIIYSHQYLDPVPSIKDGTVKNAVLERRIYEEFFEDAYLDELTQICQKESEKLLLREDLNFFRKVRQNIFEELDRAKSYVDETTQMKIVELMLKEMVGNNVKTLVGKMSLGDNDDRLQYLACMCMFFGQGNRMSLDDVCKNLGEVLDTTSENVLKLLDLKDTFDHYLVTSFNNDKNFEQIIHRLFEALLNSNKHGSKHLALFLDDKLKRISDAEQQQMLDKSSFLIRILQDKDSFLIRCKHLLLQRLLDCKPVSKVREEALIQRLKKECGFTELVVKMEAILEDAYRSDSLNRAFKFSLSKSASLNSDIVDLNVRVFSSRFFSENCATVRLPARELQAFDLFSNFYTARHGNRILSLQPNLGTAEVSFLHANEQYTLCVSTLQMLIVLLFNQGDSYTYEEVRQWTSSLSEQDLNSALLSLTNGNQNVLNKIGTNFAINEEFSSQCQRIELHRSREEVARREKEFESPAFFDRRHEIEACLVRKMKEKRQMERRSLLSEAKEELETRGRRPVAKVEMKRIFEGLVQREYVKRLHGDVYVYVP